MIPDSRRIYVIRLLGNWRTSDCVAPSSPCIPPQIRFLYISSRLRLRPPQGLLAEDTFAFGYTSALPTCGWTCSLIRTPFRVTLDAYLEVGTLAERTSKQPGRARHTTNNWRVFARTARNSQLSRWP